MMKDTRDVPGIRSDISYPVITGITVNVNTVLMMKDTRDVPDIRSDISYPVITGIRLKNPAFFAGFLLKWQ